jgi:uncharacterized protein
MARADGQGDSTLMVTVKVTVVYSPKADVVLEVGVELPAGATVADAVSQSPFNLDLKGSSLTVGVWGLLASPQQTLRHSDRVEIYRPLSVDPKAARRLRQQQQAAQTSVKKKGAR